MISRKLIKRQRGRRLITFAAAFGLLVMTMGIAGSALAVHETNFQLDGDTTNTAYSPPGGTSPAYDWDDIFNVSNDTTAGTQAVSNNGTNVGAGKTFTAASFKRDFESGADCTLTSLSLTPCTADDTTYATGSKDTLGIGNGGWQCNHDANVNSKIDIANAYVLATTIGTDKVFYFGMEKNKTNGTNDVGFWFLRGSANCSAPSGHVNFTGSHQDGDVLVVSEYTNGGGVSTIKAFRWAANALFPGDAGCIDSNDWPDPGTNAPGSNPPEKGCNQKPIAQGVDCKKSNGNDALCATTNAFSTDPNLAGSLPWNQNVTTQWRTWDASLGVGTTVKVPDFFEGGINITKAFQGAGGTVPSCFSTIVPDTRSSASPTATLFDFTLNQLGGCEASLTTTAGSTANGGSASPTSIGTGSVSSGTDTANLTITGTAFWGGTLTWYLCGPVAADGCSSAGVQVTQRTVNQSSPATDFVSTTATLTSAGRYCWTAHFAPDPATLAAGITAKDDNGVGECFTVAPVTPTLTTSATCGASPCVLGSLLTDSASLTGTATQPGSGGPSSAYPTINPGTPGAAVGGTITWVLHAGACGTTRTTTPASHTVSGNGPYSVTYQTLNTDPVGTYTFVANYGGNLPNTTAPTTTNTCASPGANETVTVVGTSSVVTRQRWLPNDRITLNTNGPTMTGTMTATLYSGTYTGTAASCSAGATATAVPGITYSFTLNNTASGSSFNTSNQTFFVGTNPDGSDGGAVGNYFWLIHVDTQLSDPTDSCETSNVQITN